MIQYKILETYKIVEKKKKKKNEEYQTRESSAKGSKIEVTNSGKRGMDKEFTIARTTFSQSHREFHLTFSFNIFIALWGTLRSSSFLQRIPSSQFFHRFPFILIGITCKIKKKEIAKSSRISSFQFLSFSQSNHQSHKHPIDLSYNRYHFYYYAKSI